MRVLVTGGRRYFNYKALDAALRAVRERYGIEVIIHGAAMGADSLAQDWADQHGVPSMPFPAEWGKHGRAAGAIRNRQMLAEGKPDGVVAFPGGKGTADMVAVAREAGVKVWEPYP